MKKRSERSDHGAEVLLYREDDGEIPLRDWLDALSVKVRPKCYFYIEQRESKGHEFRRPHADYLRDGIYELRPSYGGQQFRILYFFYGRDVVVLAHGIVKRDVVPPVGG